MSEPYPGKYDKEHNGEYRELFDPVLEFIKENTRGPNQICPALYVHRFLTAPVSYTGSMIPVKYYLPIIRPAQSLDTNLEIFPEKIWAK